MFSYYSPIRIQPELFEQTPIRAPEDMQLPPESRAVQPSPGVTQQIITSPPPNSQQPVGPIHSFTYIFNVYCKCINPPPHLSAKLLKYTGMTLSIHPFICPNVSSIPGQQICIVTFALVKYSITNSVLTN